MATTMNPPIIEDPGTLIPTKLARARPLFDPQLLRRAIGDSFRKLNPVTLMKNPVIFVVEVGAAMTTILAARDIASGAARGASKNDGSIRGMARGVPDTIADDRLQKVVVGKKSPAHPQCC